MSSQAANQIVTTLGRNIARARAEKQWSQRELAALLKVDPRDISRYENGRVVPGLTKLAALAKALDRDPGWFYTEHERAA